MKKDLKKIGLAIIGAGRVGLIRGELASRRSEEHTSELQSH